MSSLPPTLRSRPYAGTADLPALLALWPACRPAGWATDFPSPTDLMELLAAPEVAARTQVWEDATGQVAAYALVDSYNNLWFDWAPEVTAGAADALVLWGIACACDLAARTGDPASLDTACRAADGERIVLLRRHGFAEELIRTLHYARTLAEPIPEPALPMGYLIRPVAGEAEVEALVALHRFAFGTEHLTAAERLSWMRQPDYDPALDLVVVAADGSLAAYCFCAIYREENRLSGRNDGATDPVATHPAHQGRGLARGAAVRRHGAAVRRHGAAARAGPRVRSWGPAATTAPCKRRPGPLATTSNRNEFGSIGAHKSLLKHEGLRTGISTMCNQMERWRVEAPAQTSACLGLAHF